MVNAILILLIGILIISTYQLYVLYKIKKDVSKGMSFTDIKYFELKYEIESYVKIVSVLIALGAFFGYNTFVNTKAEIVNAYIEPLKKYESKIGAIDTTLLVYKDFIKNFNIEKAAIQSVLLKAGKDAKGIQSNINLLASSRVNRLNMYIVPVTMIKPKTYFFKDLKTYKGASLPKFTKAPFVQIMDGDYGMPPPAINITNESFRVDLDSEEPLIFNTWILSEE